MPRNKGSLNKVTQDTKKVLKKVLEGQIDRIELALDDVYERNTVTYLQIITKLLPYLLPKATEDTTICKTQKNHFVWFERQMMMNKKYIQIESYEFGRFYGQFS